MLNNAAIPADTSSAAAATICVVEATAAALATPTADPIPANSEDAAVAHCGTTLTNDTDDLQKPAGIAPTPPSGHAIPSSPTTGKDGTF
ncbi:hypothetical protein A5645_18665 [Mycobacterium asiaticum]|nr:hypothetical protein A5645_18665 [Mycobacterium asiaticum]